MARERIGIMGGTFNPIHRGHVAMALAAVKAASLDRVLFLPDGQPPHKRGIAPAEDRWRMVCAAVAPWKKLEPSRMELDRDGVTYTFDTLTSLRERYPKATFFYIIGEDTLLQLKNWHRSDEVLGLCSFLVCPREGCGTEEEKQQERKRLTEKGGRFVTVNMKPVDVSSTQLREALSAGETPDTIDPAVAEYAGVLGLYGGAARVPEAAGWMPRLFADLTARRFSHTMGVAWSARRLALIHGIDARRAEAAGLLHDCAKCLPIKEMQRIATDAHLTEDRAVLDSTALLHAPVGAWLAEHVYGVTDPQILSAIAAHTTGKPGMSPLDLAVFVADTIEPGRETYPLLPRIREAADRSLWEAALLCLAGTIDHVEKNGRKLNPESLQALTWICSQITGHDGGWQTAGQG